MDSLPRSSTPQHPALRLVDMLSTAVSWIAKLNPTYAITRIRWILAAAAVSVYYSTVVPGELLDFSRPLGSGTEDEEDEGQFFVDVLAALTSEDPEIIADAEGVNLTPDEEFSHPQVGFPEHPTFDQFQQVL